MSKILSNKIEVPDSIKCSVVNNSLSIKGSFGENILNLKGISVEKNEIIISKKDKSILNTYIKLIKNAFTGSISGFNKVLNLYGVGYKVEKNNDRLDFSLGYSHKISILIPESIVCEVKSNTKLVLGSFSKQLLGDFVSKILKLRTPNPYKLKGVLIEGQFVKKKEGKK